MAIKKNVQFHGLTINDAYIRVMFASVSKDFSECQVGFFADSNQPQPVFVRSYKHNEAHPFVYDLEGGNAIEQTYNYLKTLPDFVGHEDC